MLPRTKIVATLGPACWDEPILRQLLAAGVSVVRINFSHAEHGVTAEKIALIRRLADELPGRSVAILADLQGPRIRVGKLPDEGVNLVVGEEIVLHTAPEGPGIPIDYAGLPGDVEPGDVLLLDEGLLELRVTATDPAAGLIKANVTVGGLLQSRKGINVPARPLSIPAVTAEDRTDLAFALAHGVDMVALSFVRQAEDILAARALIAGQTERLVPIIAKIEKPAAVDNFDAILAAADGIMVARGDLGVEMPPEALPTIQKRLIAAANCAGKPVITATQMLDSMIRNPRPTRAEATDVANAVLDGSDAVMLSGETATGKYPLPAVQVMARIALEAETLFDFAGWTARVQAIVTAPTDPQVEAAEEPDGPGTRRAVTEAICSAADHLADELGAAAIITLTRSGASARLVAKYRPRARLVAVTDSLPTARTLAVTWGVWPLLIDQFTDTMTTLARADRLAQAAGLVAPGDLLVFTGGLPVPAPGQTTLLQVQQATLD